MSYESQIPAWRALLALPAPDQQTFVQSATAFVAARGVNPDPDRGAAPAAASVPIPTPIPVPMHTAPTLARRQRRPASLVAVAPLAAVPARGLVRPDGLAMPLIGGSALLTEPSPLFMTPAYRRRWRPGRRILVYRAGNRLLRDLIGRLQPLGIRVMGEPGLCAYKIGTHTAETDLSQRLERLTADGYGQLWRRGSTVIADPACGRWVLEPMHPGCAEPAPGSPVRIGVEAIELVLPATMTPSGFDQLLTKRLCAASLAAFALSAPGRALCELLGEDPTRFVRYSPRGAFKPRRATEITLIARHEIGRLLRVIEDIVLDHILAEDVT